MDNDWINTPLYAVEINLDSDTNEEEPQIFIAKMEYNNLAGWSKGIPPGSHGTIYGPIHVHNELFDLKEHLDEYRVITPKENMIDTMSTMAIPFTKRWVGNLSLRQKKFMRCMKMNESMIYL